MNRSHFAWIAIAAALLASAPAQAGRPRGMHVVDSDFVSLPYIEQDSLYRLILMADAGGQFLLLDQSDATPMRVTPLGFSYPTGSTWGSYTATPDGSVWGAFSSRQGIRIYDLGDLEQPGPLAPVLLQAEPAMVGFDPRQTQMGIIAILIGLLAEPRPSIALTSVTDGTSNTIMFGWDGDSFEAVEPVGDGTWSFDRPQ